MELFLFARFHAHPGNGAALREAIHTVAGPTKLEPGCLDYQAFFSLCVCKASSMSTHGGATTRRSSYTRRCLTQFSSYLRLKHLSTIRSAFHSPSL
jgi:hypothetical protein